MRIPKYFIVLFIFGLMPFWQSCESLETVNNNKPDREKVLAVGSDLKTVLQGGYISWWQGVHGEHPVIALGVASDVYSMSWGNFGAQRFGF